MFIRTRDRRFTSSRGQFVADELGKAAGTETQRVFGYVGLGLSFLAALAIVAGLPWQIRFPLVVIAVLFGPGVPLMLGLSQWETVKNVVAGVGLDVALVLLAGEAMVVVHVWQPDYMVGILLALSAIASVLLLMRSPVSGSGAHHA